MTEIDPETITECLLEPLFAVNSDSDIVFVNARFLEITQLSRNEIIGSNVDLFGQFVTDGFETLRDAIESVSTAEADDQRVELLMQHSPRAPVPERLTAEARVGPLMRDGARIGTLVTLRDVTEEKKRRQELERHNNRLDEFASVVSHDLRNPLNVASLRLRLAREECDSEHLDDVANALDRMETLIEDLLTVARQGKQVEETDVVALPEVIRECLSNIPAEKPTLVIESEKSLYADPSRLKQLTENLMRNAVEHGREDVTITVGDLQNGFYFADDGPGIPEDEREKVFDAGYSSTDDGTGFGLNIVQQIAEAHGWEVQVTESSDGGARFEITDIEFAD